MQAMTRYKLSCSPGLHRNPRKLLGRGEQALSHWSGSVLVVLSLVGCGNAKCTDYRTSQTDKVSATVPKRALAPELPFDSDKFCAKLRRQIASADPKDLFSDCTQFVEGAKRDYREIERKRLGSAPIGPKGFGFDALLACMRLQRSSGAAKFCFEETRGEVEELSLIHI